MQGDGGDPPGLAGGDLIQQPDSEPGAAKAVAAGLGGPGGQRQIQVSRVSPLASRFVQAGNVRGSPALEAMRGPGR